MLCHFFFKRSVKYNSNMCLQPDYLKQKRILRMLANASELNNLSDKMLDVNNDSKYKKSALDMIYEMSIESLTGKWKEKVKSFVTISF